MLTNEPSNKAIQPILARLHDIVQKRHHENTLTTNKVKQMFEIAFDMEADKEKRETALNNLLVLARERAGNYNVIQVLKNTFFFSIFIC